jgi:CO/xanthine dehydrogenase FAD-binding subunit
MSLYPIVARPRSLAEATGLLGSLSSGTVVIAGGQELMPSVNYGQLMPEVFVDITGLAELRGIRIDAERLSIGALTVHRELQTDALVREHAPLLAESVAHAGGGRQVHNRATLGGNIVAMHPLYDIAPSLLAMHAEVEIAHGEATSVRRLADVVADTSHALGSGAVLTRVLVPPMRPTCGYAYEKLKLSGGAYGSANGAAIVTLDNGRLASLRLVIGAASERQVDASAELAGLVGTAWDENAAARTDAIVCGLITSPLSDHQGDGDWRRAMAGIVARRALTRAVAVARARGGSD